MENFVDGFDGNNLISKDDVEADKYADQSYVY